MLLYETLIALYYPAEIHIDMSMDQNNHEVHITCNSNFEQLDNFDLIGPQVKIPDRYRHCEDNECRWTLEYPHIGEYHCEHTLDNYSITSNKTMIPSRNDNESTPITTYTSTDKNRIIIISVGIVGVALLIVSIAAITVSIVLCCIVKHHRYQRVPPNDPGKDPNQHTDLVFSFMHCTLSLRGL